MCEQRHVHTPRRRQKKHTLLLCSCTWHDPTMGEESWTSKMRPRLTIFEWKHHDLNPCMDSTLRFQDVRKCGLFQASRKMRKQHVQNHYQKTQGSRDLMWFMQKNGLALSKSIMMQLYIQVVYINKWVAKSTWSRQLWPRPSSQSSLRSSCTFRALGELAGKCMCLGCSSLVRGRYWCTATAANAANPRTLR